MARKKTVIEPQEEQNQDTAAPMEEFVDGGGSLTPADEADEGGEASQFGNSVTGNESGPDDGAGLMDGETPPAPAEFPPSEEEPFTGALEGDAAWGDTASSEQDEAGGVPVLESGEDYNALLSEVGSALPIDTTPLVLDEAGRQHRTMVRRTCLSPPQVKMRYAMLGSSLRQFLIVVRSSPPVRGLAPGQCSTSAAARC